jgi:hypothetical protein
VHVASEERRRLSAGSEESRPSTSPVLDNHQHQGVDQLTKVRITQPDAVMYAYRNDGVSAVDPSIGEARPHKRRRTSSSMENDRGLPSISASEDERDRYAQPRHAPFEHDHRIVVPRPLDVGEYDRFPPASLSGPGLRGPGMMELPQHRDGFIRSNLGEERRSSLGDQAKQILQRPDVMPEGAGQNASPDIKLEDLKKKTSSHLKAIKDRDKDKVGEGGYSRPKQVDKVKRQEPDAHEWLLEHYARSSPPAPLAAPLSQPTKARTQTPEAVTALEQELEDLSPDKGDVVKAEIDVEHGSELMRQAGRDGNSGSMDVEDELLSLLDDQPAAPPPLHVLPFMDTSSSTRRHPSIPPTPIKSTASPSPFVTHPIGRRPSESPSVSTPAPDRESMPPPTLTNVRGSSEAKDRAGTTAAMRRKDATKVRLALFYKNTNSLLRV